VPRRPSAAPYGGVSGGGRFAQREPAPAQRVAQAPPQPRRERGDREFFALQESLLFDLWACAGIDEILSALQERLVVGSL
jgi:hypothetical protein